MVEKSMCFKMGMLIIHFFYFMYGMCILKWQWKRKKLNGKKVTSEQE